MSLECFNVNFSCINIIIVVWVSEAGVECTSVEVCVSGPSGKVFDTLFSVYNGVGGAVKSTLPGHKQQPPLIARLFQLSLSTFKVNS